MTYRLLKGAPPADTPEFIDYLRDNNPVVFENPQWLVIKNCKYHTKKKPWYTAFHKIGCTWEHEPGKSKKILSDWYDDIDILYYEFFNFEWLRKHPKRQTVPERFHIHLTPKQFV